MYKHYNDPNCLCARCNGNDFPEAREVYTIQKVYLLHDYLYASIDLIPAESLDGKDQPAIRYITVSEPITELDSTDRFIYKTEAEAREALSELA